MPQPSTYRATLCASLRKRNARQHFTGAALYGNWQKNAAAQIEPRTRTHTLCVNISQEPLYTQIYRKNAAAQIETRTRTHTLCEPAQSKRTPTFHTSHFIRKFTGKMPRPRLSPERGHTLCASSRSRNARQHFTRATWYRNLKEKCRRPDWHTHTRPTEAAFCQKTLITRREQHATSTKHGRK